MRPFYEQLENNLEIYKKISSHVSPHVHKSLECVYVTDGTLELGIGQEFFHIEQGDLAIIFPDLIHHYQVFSAEQCTSVYLLASPSLSGRYLPTLQQFCPETPVISACDLHPDILYALKSLASDLTPPESDVIHNSYIQLILARSLPHFHLVEKSSVDSNDIIYQTVSYIASHFMETITLSSMAHDLGVSPFALSRVFSGTFHTNFNQYLNDVRLEYATGLLLHTNNSVTDIYMTAGFESQRTFNRVFKERYRMSPRDYRKQQTLLSSSQTNKRNQWYRHN